jgi:hypothetical protein
VKDPHCREKRPCDYRYTKTNGERLQELEQRQLLYNKTIYGKKTIAQVLIKAERASKGRNMKRRRAPSFKVSLPMDIAEFSPYLLTPQR